MVLLAACSACSSKPSAPAASADAWAVVDGREIKREDVERAYRRVVDPRATPSEEEALLSKITLLNDLITQDLLMAKAKALGIEATGTEIENAFAERKKATTEEVFQKELNDRRLTVADIREDLRRELTTQKLIEREVTSKVAATDQEITDYFNANRAQFNLAEPAYRIAQIVITPVKDEQINNRLNDDARSADAAAKKAKMISDKLRAGGRFSELAMDYSEDPQTAPQGGDLGLISATQLRQTDPALRDAVLKAQPGTISQVSAGGGHMLVLLISKEAAGQRDLSTPGVKDSIAQGLKDRRQQMLQAAYFTVIRNEAQVTNLLAKQVVDQRSKAAPVSVAPSQPGKK